MKIENFEVHERGRDFSVHFFNLNSQVPVAQKTGFRRFQG